MIKINFKVGSPAYFIISFIGIILILLSKDIPFFWDNVTIAQIADYYYAHHLRLVKLPPALDYGVFSLYGYYIAVFWTVFGKSLLVSHIAFIPVFLGTFWEIYRILELYLIGWIRLLLVIFLFTDPALLTQSALMAYDIFLLWFMLAALRRLWEKRFKVYPHLLLAMTLISVRSIIFIFCLLLIHIFRSRFIDQKFKWREFNSYLPAFGLMIAWMIFHYYKTGWILFTTERNPFRSINPPMQMLRAAGYVAWKLVDSGRIFIWLIVLIGSISCFRRLYKSRRNRFLLASILLPLMVYGALLVIISNPVGHKYFLITYVLLSLLCVIILSHIKNRKLRKVIIFLVLIGLIGGNYIVYPQKYGNAWDTSMKIMPWFKAERQMKDFIVDNKIAPSKVFTDFPLTTNRAYTYLDEDFSYRELLPDSLSKCQYVLFSNVMNVADLTPYIKVQKKWILMKEIRAGETVLALYKNPD